MFKEYENTPNKVIPFTKVPNSLFDNPNTKWNPYILLQYIWSKPKGWRHYRQHYAQKAGVTVKTISMWLNYLEKSGEIKRTYSWSKEGKCSDLYIKIIDETESPSVNRIASNKNKTYSSVELEKETVQEVDKIEKPQENIAPSAWDISEKTINNISSEFEVKQLSELQENSRGESQPKKISSFISSIVQNVKATSSQEPQKNSTLQKNVTHSNIKYNKLNTDIKKSISQEEKFSKQPEKSLAEKSKARQGYGLRPKSTPKPIRNRPCNEFNTVPRYKFSDFVDPNDPNSTLREDLYEEISCKIFIDRPATKRYVEMHIRKMALKQNHFRFYNANHFIQQVIRQIKGDFNQLSSRVYQSSTYTPYVILKHWEKLNVREA